jgi:hypothetical protein
LDTAASLVNLYAFYCCHLGSGLAFRMRKLLLLIAVLATVSACDQLPFGNKRNATRLSDREFVEIYIKLAKARSLPDKERILKQHGTTKAELEEFVRANVDDLPALSEVFDTVVARIGAPREEYPIPVLPGR